MHLPNLQCIQQLQVAAAQALGQKVIGEPVASGLGLHEGLMQSSNWTLAAQYVMSPPIRAAHHGAALKQVGRILFAEPNDGA